MSNTSLDEQKQNLDNLIQKLNGLIKKLPTTLPCGSKDGPLAKHFSDHMYDATEGPYFTFNQSWERVFQQCADSQKEYLVVRGKYGLDLVQAYIVHFAKIPGIEANNGLSLLAQRVEALIALIEAMYFFDYMNLPRN
jgi:hypothetical protein